MATQRGALDLINGGRAADAQRILSEALVRNPDDAQLLWVLSRALRHQGRLDDAVEVADLALRADPTSADAFISRYQALAKTPGRSDEALVAAETALRLAPAASITLGAVANGRLAVGDPTGATDVARRMVASFPNHIVGWDVLGRAALRGRDYDSAARHFAECLRLSPDNSDAMNNLALAELSLGRSAVAHDLYLRAARAEPTSERAVSVAQSISGIAIQHYNELSDPATAIRQLGAESKRLVADGRGAEIATGVLRAVYAVRLKTFHRDDPVRALTESIEILEDVSRLDPDQYVAEPGPPGSPTRLPRQCCWRRSARRCGSAGSPTAASSLASGWPS